MNFVSEDWLAAVLARGAWALEGYEFHFVGVSLEAAPYKPVSNEFKVWGHCPCRGAVSGKWSGTNGDAGKREHDLGNG